MKKLEEYVRTIPDFPEPGIMFRDVTSVIQDKDGLHAAIDALQGMVENLEFDVAPGLLPLLERQQLLQQACAILSGVPPVYVCSPDGSPFAPEALNRALAADIAAAGVRPINLHGLRHSMATLAVSLGVSMRVLQQLLGHADYSTTANTYAHVLHNDERNALAQIAQVVL